MGRAVQSCLRSLLPGSDVSPTLEALVLCSALEALVANPVYCPAVGSIDEAAVRRVDDAAVAIDERLHVSVVNG